MPTRISQAAQVARSYAGFRRASIARSTGTLVVLVDAMEQGIADPPQPIAWDENTGKPTAWLPADRWALICEGKPGGPTHGSICTWSTQAGASSHLSAPEAFCDYCRDGVEPEEGP